MANQRFFDLLNHQDRRQEALARNSLVTDLVSKSASLAADFERITKGIKIEDQEALDAVKRVNPEDFYKLTAKIIDKSKAEKGGIPTLQASSLVAVLRSFEIPSATIHHESTESVTRQNGGGCVVS